MNEDQYILIKKICREEEIDYVALNDKERTIKIDDNDIDKLEIEFLLYVTACGMDSKQNYYTEYGKKVYRLFDYILNGGNQWQKMITII